MKKRGWVLTIALWLCFGTAFFLYFRFRLEWVNTLDLLLTFAVLLVFSVWYVIQTPGKSRWVLGRNGALYRIKQRK